MTTKYLAIKGYDIQQVRFKQDVITMDIICNYIEDYGTDFIGIFDTFNEAKYHLLADYILFGDDNLGNLKDVEHLERCLQLDTEV